jgi:3-deoxy-7-phosphoheptulonate synthase
MLITLKEESTHEDVQRIRSTLEQHKVGHCISQSEKQKIVGLEVNLEKDVLDKLKHLSCIQSITPTSTPHKMASLSYKTEKTVIEIGPIKIGGEKVILMAGPCAIESLEQLILVGTLLKKMGVSILRGSAYKPRTSPYSFQGLGAEGLKLHLQAKKEHGLLIETEIMDVRDIDIVAEHVDIVRIGARNMQNYPLLKEVGKCKKPVILKRGIAATVEEWLLSAEYIMAHGNHQVILCERGIRTFENTTRNTLDLSSVAVAKTLTHLPVIVDPSHAAGRKDIIPALSKAAIALGADGLLIEVHHLPKESLCDAKQALSPEEFSAIREDLEKITKAIGRSL